MIDVYEGDYLTVLLPYSEVCMHLRVAGTVMWAQVLADGVQLRDEHGAPYSFPIGHGEAGVRLLPAEAPIAVDCHSCGYTGTMVPDGRIDPSRAECRVCN
jgi:hypothetical protein